MASHAHCAYDQQDPHHHQRWGHPPDARRARPRPRPPLRLKCIVLGSAGAGKTSLLRRFVHGTFEGSGGAGNGGDPTAGTGSGSGRGTASTLGADYYVRTVDNPLFGREPDDGGRSGGGGDVYGDVYDVDDDGWRDGGHEDEKKQSPRSDDAYAGDDGGRTPTVRDEPRATVQLWDTVGRTRLRHGAAARPSRHPDVDFYQFLSARRAPSPPPPSSDDERGSGAAVARLWGGRYYEHRYNNWGFDRRRAGATGRCLDAEDEGDDDDGDDGDSYANSEGGEAPRRGRFDAGCRRRRGAKSPRGRGANEPGGDALFRNVDACMLVYDAT